jgi:hypothetical protein
MNMATVIAVYAVLCKEMGLPLWFPGTAKAYGGIMEMTDADLLAKAIVWAGENDGCDGEAFNITNGDFNRWANLWPRLAGSPWSVTARNWHAVGGALSRRWCCLGATRPTVRTL